MNETVKVICENTNSELYVNMGQTLADVACVLALKGDYPFLAAYVNNRFKELGYRIYEPVTIRFIDITHFEGIRVYQRTLFFTLSKAIHDLYPSRILHIKHAVSKGFYCEIDGISLLSDQEIDSIRLRMEELVDQNIPIVPTVVPTSEAEVIYSSDVYSDKLTLLRSRPRLYSTIYRLADVAGYFYGALAISTGCLYLFDIQKYVDGFYLAVPKRLKPDELEPMVQQDKMFDVFNEYKSWVDIIGVSTIGSLNNKINDGKASELIKMAEAFHEKKFGNIADSILEANISKGTRMVLISGPSSSGKTTCAKRLGIQLRILGLNPVLLSLDDYFVEREKTPIDENGDYDYESLYALDLHTFNDHLTRLMRGESVDIPRYDFITGLRFKHEHPLCLDERSILVVEGIHGLNPELTSEIAENLKFKIYISALTSVSMDNLSRISTTDSRLLRRMVRDYYTRGMSAIDTLKRWGSVRRGEDKHIFPYQENANVMFNSSLFYEISVLRKFVEPMLYEVPNTVPEHAEARRLLKFLDNFNPIAPDEIPPTSIIREFVGGSSFKY